MPGLRPQPLPAATRQLFNHLGTLAQAVDQMETKKLFAGGEGGRTFFLNAQPVGCGAYTYTKKPVPSSWCSCPPSSKIARNLPGRVTIT
ncbi:hypothetical protein GH733_009864 [Mirounga leonina]|nr:hypothetical protein GH733_009864 [Mirounga leonina]